MSGKIDEIRLSPSHQHANNKNDHVSHHVITRPLTSRKPRIFCESQNRNIFIFLNKATMWKTPERFASNTDYDIATMLENKKSSSTKKPQSKRLKFFELTLCTELNLTFLEN